MSSSPEQQLCIFLKIDFTIWIVILKDSEIITSIQVSVRFELKTNLIDFVDYIHTYMHV